MNKETAIRVLFVAMLALSACVSSAPAQEATEHRTEQQGTEAERSKTEESKLPEVEFVGSTSFRSAALVQSLWSHLSFEGHYFGGDENNVGYTAGSWTFHGEHWKIAPGFGVSFGDNEFRTMPAFSIRWGYERGWFISEGLFVQGLLHTNFLPEGTEPEPGHSAEESVVPSIADGNHLSARWKRLTVGGMWEHMQFREGKEWKGGVRVAYRVLPHLSFTFFAMGPGSEIRGGILFQPKEE
jgi:hypothetical protein